MRPRNRRFEPITRPLAVDMVSEAEPHFVEPNIELPFSEAELAKRCTEVCDRIRTLTVALQTNQALWGAAETMKEYSQLKIGSPRLLAAASHDISLAQLQQILETATDDEVIFDREDRLQTDAALRAHEWQAVVLLAVPELTVPETVRRTLGPSFIEEVLQSRRGYRRNPWKAMQVDWSASVLRAEPPLITPELLRRVHQQYLNSVEEARTRPTEINLSRLLRIVSKFNTIADSLGQEPIELPPTFNEWLKEAYRSIDDYRPMEYDPSQEDVRHEFQTLAAFAVQLINSGSRLERGRLVSHQPDVEPISLPSRKAA